MINRYFYFILLLNAKYGIQYFQSKIFLNIKNEMLTNTQYLYVICTVDKITIFEFFYRLMYEHKINN